MGIGPIKRLQETWERRPLSFQLVAVITSLLAAGLMMSGTVMIGLLQRHLVSQIDDQLANASVTLSAPQMSAPSETSTALPSLYYIRQKIRGQEATSVYYPETLEESGTPIIPELLPVGQEAATPSGATLPVTVKSSLPGSLWRAIAIPLYTSESAQPIGVLTIALPLTGVQRTLSATGMYLTIAAAVIVVVGGTIANWLVRRSLSPLRTIEYTAGKIAAGDLTQRVRPGPATTEVGSLALSLNAMLSQVEQSFEARQASERRIRRFVSDASHELRTPLAAISGYCELYSMGGVPQDRTDDVMGRISSESTRMSALVEDLLTLARLDEGRPLDLTDVDLVKMADNAVFDLQALDPTRTASLQSLTGLNPPMTLVVSADRDRIQQVFTNVIGNIIRYTPEGSPVEIALNRVGKSAVVEFRDHGPGIADADRTRVFERFYRADSSRNRHSGGSGLGLSIVSSILAAHHGNAELAKTKGGGLTVRIELPLTRAEQAGAPATTHPRRPA
ncbi:HAMP domain-containing histidine kinase [Actinomyces sp. B33]|uniref:sensor histidine kinase n=1 Tax=Actinomyces sp. B33 TaxID=2942131 RepID=UPI00233FB9F4|nr:HAMP domain-containing sensor histidine kinase [Actinomyces sp. B33]MDC4232221.1 HAMP domain-containing histidine kinase [Actinomyces sp. B33]